MNARFRALEIAGARHRSNLNENERVSKNNSNTSASVSQTFGKDIFSRDIMQKMLPKEVYKNILNAMEGREKIKPEFADTIAVAMKEWAAGKGATHYSHWFQPLTGATAEKHDSFIDWAGPGQVIERFSGKQLIQGEPDASSFPSGGLRSTYEARGYTGWDPTSPAFVWEGGDGVTLCIPSVFFSWTGDVLDSKIPLLRADKAINDAVLRLLKLTGISANHVYSTLGLEQEYFVIDRALRNLRPDLMLIGRTVYGASSPKGQELQDHYFGAVKDRILSFMRDFEEEALKLGIPVKTRHNEVAPAQHEVAPVFEKASTAIDHNILLMEIMRRVAVKHDLACLLHEKPFKGLNGSGKHSNWSLSTDTGINLLDPSDTPENNLHFLVLLTAILHAVHEHAALLRASIGSAANDYRLGGHEAPPAIISVYLGEALEALIENLEKKGRHTSSSEKIKFDLGYSFIAELTKDNTDRNRTSPFAFTGNKFEFRAVGSSASPALPATVLNAIVAQSLNQILDEIEGNLDKRKTLHSKAFADAAIDIIRKYLRSSKNIRFHGDNYSGEWIVEAKRRHLPIMMKSIDAFDAFKSKKTIEAFKGILSEQELISRYEILCETYFHTLNIEVNLMLDIFHTQILPAAIKYQKELATSIHITKEVLDSKKECSEQASVLKIISKSIEKALHFANQLRDARDKGSQFALSSKGKIYIEKVLPLCEQLREIVDFIETQTDDTLWPLPKYRELLFLI